MKMKKLVRAAGAGITAAVVAFTMAVRESGVSGILLPEGGHLCVGCLGEQFLEFGKRPYG